jgi:hypothetical protein
MRPCRWQTKTDVFVWRFLRGRSAFSRPNNGSPRMRQQRQHRRRVQPPHRARRHMPVRRAPRNRTRRTRWNAPGLGRQVEHMARLCGRGNVVGAQLHGNESNECFTRFCEVPPPLTKTDSKFPDALAERNEHKEHKERNACLRRNRSTASPTGSHRPLPRTCRSRPAPRRSAARATAQPRCRRSAPAGSRR